MNSSYTFKETDGVLFVGDRESQDLYDTQLIGINHLVASSVEPLVPVSLSQSLTIKVVLEHNGLLVTGPRTCIARLEDFIKEIDIPTAQVLFEVLVVEYTTSDRAEFGITANNFGGESGLPGQVYWSNWDVSANGEDVNDALRSIERRLGLPNLGVLDPNFFIRLQMMEQEGKATVQSRPQIATLNGHSASISIGTTQYYLMESQTIYPSQQTSVSTQTSQRFETIKADMSLVVTPYVSKNGDVIVEVSPEFSTPAGQFDPEIPPTINSRVLNSTVRLKNGETIVLGGLVQETKRVNVDKVPILGSIPIIGRLFQNRSSSNDRSELMIYITPHVYFGSEGAVDLDSLIIQR
jgi:type IV pilus assembly protein PilQ